MSGVHPPGGGSPGNDPSMEDILASIRRILSEDEQGTPPAVEEPPPPADISPPQAAGQPADDVLVLDNSMLVPELDPIEATSEEAKPEPASAAVERSEFGPESGLFASEPSASDMLAPELLGPEAAAAATSSVGNLVRTLAAGRTTHVHHGGPTIEDVVREEVRPLLKQWLDQNLPPLVERLVRLEIERVVGRAVP